MFRFFLILLPFAQSAGRLLVCVVLIVYLLVAVPYLEEYDLIALFGEQYKAYIRSTAMLFPLPPTKRSTAGKEKN